MRRIGRGPEPDRCAPFPIAAPALGRAPGTQQRPSSRECLGGLSRRDGARNPSGFGSASARAGCGRGAPARPGRHGGDGLRPGPVFVECAGRIARVATRLHDDAHLLHVIDRILAPLDRRVDKASPMVDARLPDGSRVKAVIPPLALDGPALTIQRFAGRSLMGADLVGLGTIDRPMLGLLTLAVRARGATCSSPAAPAAARPPPWQRWQPSCRLQSAWSPSRTLTELCIALAHVARLESRPPSLEGAGAVSIRALVRNALRMRPNRIVVGGSPGARPSTCSRRRRRAHEPLDLYPPRRAVSRRLRRVHKGGYRIVCTSCRTLRSHVSPSGV